MPTVTFDKVPQFADDATEVFIRNARTKQYIGSYCRHKKKGKIHNYSVYLPYTGRSASNRFYAADHGGARGALKAMKKWVDTSYSGASDMDKVG
jgi:hypothetical protein